MNITYNGLRRILLGNEVVEQKLWVASAVAKSKLPEDLVKHCVKVSLDENPQLPESVDKKQAAVASQIIKAARQDFNKAAKIIEEKKAKDEADRLAAKAAKEQEKKDLEETKTGLANLFLEADAQSTEIVEAGRFETLRDELVAGALGEHFVLADGNITLKDGENAKEAFASGFANLNRLVNTADDMKGGIALYEAKLALAASKHPDIGDLWPNFFNGAKDSDISRIKKGIAAIKTAEELGIDIGTIPLSTVRVLFEAKYSDNADENKALKKQAFDTFVEKSDAAGHTLPQTAAKALVSEIRPKTQRGEAVTRWKFFYFLKDGTKVGTTKFDKVLFENAQFVLNDGLQEVTIDKEGDLEFTNIPAPTAKDAPKEEPKAAEKPATKKAASKKAAKPAPAPEPTPEPATESVEDTSATPDGEPEVEELGEPEEAPEKAEDDFGLGDL